MSDAMGSRHSPRLADSIGRSPKSTATTRRDRRPRGRGRGGRSGLSGRIETPPGNVAMRLRGSSGDSFPRGVLDVSRSVYMNGS